MDSTRTVSARGAERRGARSLRRRRRARRDGSCARAPRAGRPTIDRTSISSHADAGIEFTESPPPMRPTDSVVRGSGRQVQSTPNARPRRPRRARRSARRTRPTNGRQVRETTTRKRRDPSARWMTRSSPAPSSAITACAFAPRPREVVLGASQIANAFLAGGRDELDRTLRSHASAVDLGGEREHDRQATAIVVDAGADEALAVAADREIGRARKNGVEVRADHDGRKTSRRPRAGR